MSEKESLSRKAFVALGAGSVAAIATTDRAVAAGEPHRAAAAPHKPPKKSSAQGALGERPEAYAYFTGPEVAFMEAAVERLIPSDAHGPGAREAGAAYFIDQQLAGRYGRGETMYSQGPFGEALPTQGYQLRYSPADVYRLGIAATNAYTQRVYKKTFDQLDGAHQDAVLTALEKGTVTFDDAPATTFFGMLLGDTIQGFFSDPMYGGNRDKIGWKTVGFPGVGAVYFALVDKHNKPYVVEPVGIADEMQHTMALHDGVEVPHIQTRVAARAASKDVT
jgi:gluconate 2-dehydrogenase gamma chain